MVLYLLLVTAISAFSIHASEEKKDISSYDACPGLLFTSNEISFIARVWNSDTKTWSYKTRLSDGSKASSIHDPRTHRAAGQPPVFGNEYETRCFVPGQTNCNFTAYKEQYDLVAAIHKKHMWAQFYATFGAQGKLRAHTSKQ